MVTDSDIAREPLVDVPGDADASQRRKRRVRVRRKQDKFPRPLRLALLLGAPIVLWFGIYFVGRALL